MFPKAVFLYCFILLNLLLNALNASGQQAIGDTLKEVNIRSEKVSKLYPDLRRDFAAGQQNQKIDSAVKTFYQNRSLAQLLEEQSAVFIKSYGVNGMATLSFRGASAAQSAVLWNGVPLTNPALGMADVSLLNSGLFDHIALQYGSSSALYGSGNVGGALLLDDDAPDFSDQRHVTLSLGGGSFSGKNAALKTVFQNQRWRLKGNIFYEQAKNDFSYRDAKGQEQKMDNAAAEGLGGIFSADYNLDKKQAAAYSKHTLSLKLWYQQYDRRIPPALFEAFSVKEQLDRSFHSLIRWQKEQKRSTFYTKFSYNRDDLHYQDGVVLPDNENSMIRLYGEAGWRWRIDRPHRASYGASLEHRLLVFAPFQYAQAIGSNLNNKMKQFRPALALAYDLTGFNNRLKMDAMLRQEWNPRDRPATLPGLGIAYRIIQRNSSNGYLTLKLRGNIQRSYRVPSLNELYFSPGGNENLKPESGWNEDGGFAFNYIYQKNTQPVGGHRNKWIFHQETSIYNRDIKDWIYWLGGAIWTPHNLAEVHSRGIETDNSILFQRKKLMLQAAVKTAYTLSTTVASYMPNDGSIDKQIPYTPRYNVQWSLGVHYAGFFFNYSHTYTGYRFTTVDESQYLPPYQMGNVQAQYAFKCSRYLLKITLQVMNIYGAHYEVVSGRPMPGRYFLIGLQAGL